MKKVFNICNLYILLWCLYYLQGTLYQKGSFLSQGILLLLFLISIYYVFYSFAKYKLPSFFKGLTAFVLLLTIYGLLLIFSGEVIYAHHLFSDEVGNFSYLKSVYISLLPIFPFYVFGKKGFLTESSFRYWAPIFIIIATLSFNYKEDELLLEAMLSGSDREDFVNNVGYTFLSLIPMAVFYRNKPMLQYVMLAYCVLYVIMGMKRGAIIISGLCVPVFIYMTIKNSNRRTKNRLRLLGVAIIVVIVLILQYYMKTNDFFNLRLEQTLAGRSSGRDMLYAVFWDHFVYRTTALQFFIGSGALSTLKIAGQYAHNDWLELAVNQGILGIAVYLYYWLVFFETWRRSKFSDYTCYVVLGLLLIICFSRSFFSMSYGEMEFYTTMMLGYCIVRSNIVNN